MWKKSVLIRELEIIMRMRDARLVKWVFGESKEESNEKVR